MPSGLPGPKAPNAAGQAWLDKWHKLYNYQVPAGAWITYTAVHAWANAVTQVGDAYDFKAVNKYLKENGYEGLQGKIAWDKDNVLRLQKGSPEVHYQVQGGELQAIYTDPPLTPYPGAEFKKPGWIK
jgi:ABC-type branched-subunit amino acid transport system substrate-binding protein